MNHACMREHLFSTIFMCLLTVLVVSFSLSPLLVPHAEATENTWATMAPMPTARAGLGVAVVKGKIYAIGGVNDSITGINEEYDPATNTWTTKEPMPTPRVSFGIAVHQNKIYVIGGESTNGVTGANEVYDPATDTWSTNGSLPTPRRGLDANVVNDKIYLIGGLAKGVGPWYANVSGLTEVYDPATDSWTTKTSIPTPVFSYASAVVDNKIYVIGGSTDTVAEANLNQIYDPETDTWASGKPPATRVTEAEAGATTGLMAPKRIYVIGGRIIDEGGARATTQVYNPENDSWTFGASMITARFHLAIAVANDKLYAIGGYSFYQSIPPHKKCEENEQYTPVGYGTLPPTISIVLPVNKTYTANNVSLTFTVNKPASWIAYSLDGQENVTITENTTLTGLSNGLHTLIVYANFTFWYTGASETIYFTVVQQEPFPVIWVVAPTALAIVAVAGYLFLKRKRLGEGV